MVRCNWGRLGNFTPGIIRNVGTVKSVVIGGQEIRSHKSTKFPGSFGCVLCHNNWVALGIEAPVVLERCIIFVVDTHRYISKIKASINELALPHILVEMTTVMFITIVIDDCKLNDSLY